MGLSKYHLSELDLSMIYSLLIVLMNDYYKQHTTFVVQKYVVFFESSNECSAWSYRIPNAQSVKYYERYNRVKSPEAIFM